jgi:hypothetical protein
MVQAQSGPFFYAGLRKVLMKEKTTSKRDKPAPKTREDRLKEALRANLRRRKDQARARSGSDKQKD